MKQSKIVATQRIRVPRAGSLWTLIQLLKMFDILGNNEVADSTRNIDSRQRMDLPRAELFHPLGHKDAKCSNIALTQRIDFPRAASLCKASLQLFGMRSTLFDRSGATTYHRAVKSSPDRAEATYRFPASRVCAPRTASVGRAVCSARRRIPRPDCSTIALRQAIDFLRAANPCTSALSDKSGTATYHALQIGLKQHIDFRRADRRGVVVKETVQVSKTHRNIINADSASLGRAVCSAVRLAPEISQSN